MVVRGGYVARRAKTYLPGNPPRSGRILIDRIVEENTIPGQARRDHIDPLIKGKSKSLLERGEYPPSVGRYLVRGQRAASIELDEREQRVEGAEAHLHAMDLQPEDLEVGRYREVAVVSKRRNTIRGVEGLVPCHSSSQAPGKRLKAWQGGERGEDRESGLRLRGNGKPFIPAAIVVFLLLGANVIFMKVMTTIKV